jgi:hypothetical protein
MKYCCKCENKETKGLPMKWDHKQPKAQQAEEKKQEVIFALRKWIESRVRMFTDPDNPNSIRPRNFLVPYDGVDGTKEFTKNEYERILKLKVFL